MSGWIKWEKELEADPRMLRMVREWKRMCNASGVTCAFNPVTLLCGGLVRLWSYADSHIREDDTLDLGASEIDELIGIENFCQLMPSDWLEVVDEVTVKLPNFQAHNGVEAKKRALTQKRVEAHRERTRNALGVTDALPDQTRPDQTKKKEMSAPPTEVAEVFEHWKQTHSHPQAKLDEKRSRLISSALKTYSVENLKTAISGYKNSPHHMGQNERRTVYDDIEVFLRDAKHIDAGIKLASSSSAIQWQ